jgi:hypothetical protein
LADPVVTVSRGALFSRGEEVTLTVDGEKKKLRLSWLAGAELAKTESFYYILVAMFTILYVALMFFS